MNSIMKINNDTVYASFKIIKATLGNHAGALGAAH